MRGTDIQRDGQFRTVIQQERVPADHLLHPIRVMVNTALKERHGDFNALYQGPGRDSIPPEQLLRVQLLMAFCTIRSERRLMEQINHNLLFRWFAGFSTRRRGGAVCLIIGSCGVPFPLYPCNAMQRSVRRRSLSGR